MAASLLQAAAAPAGGRPAEGGCDQEDDWDHTKCVRRNLPQFVISEVDRMPEEMPSSAGCYPCGVKLLPCTQVPHGIWYNPGQPKATPKQPRSSEKSDYLYARLVTLTTYHRVLGTSSVRSIFSVIGHYSLLNMACEVATSREYADVEPSCRAAFVGCVAIPILLWVTMCARAAWRELQSHQKTGDYAPHEWMEHMKDLANIFIFQLLAIPRSVKDAPVMYHPRKPNQPFCAIKLRNQRMWILGYMCEEQSVFEEEQGQENQLPLYLCHIPAFVLQAYIALCLGAWCASSVLTMLVSFTFLFMNLLNIFTLQSKKRVYLDALKEAARALEEKILHGPRKDTDLDKLGTLDKLFCRDFGQRCSEDKQVLEVLDAYTAKTFLGQKKAEPNPPEGEEEEEEEEYSALLGLRQAACCWASKASTREDDGSRGSTRTCQFHSRGSSDSSV